MERGASEYSQSDQTSTTQYTPQSEVRSSTGLSSSNTPQSEYGLNPSSARSTTGYPAEYLARSAPYHSAPPPQGPVGSMAQAANPSIAQQASPAYQPPFSPYNQGSHEIPPYAGQPPPGMYRQNPPEWPQYGHSHAMPGQYSGPGPNMSSASPATTGSRSQVNYSFVPIPGAHQHKRPRRRYEEIERMYKCGWKGCEKSYGTLNHLNAHVTMQSHGQKRTPDEFKTIRQEWRARKKEEETLRRRDEDRSRAEAAVNQAAAGQVGAGQVDGQTTDPPGAAPATSYPPGSRAQLPPLGFQSAQGGDLPSPYAGQQSNIVYQQGNGQMGQYGQYAPPHMQYGQQGQVYQQHSAASYQS